MLEKCAIQKLYQFENHPPSIRGGKVGECGLSDVTVVESFQKKKNKGRGEERIIIKQKDF